MIFTTDFLKGALERAQSLTLARVRRLCRAALHALHTRHVGVEGGL